MEGRETEQSDAQLRLPLHKKGHTTTLRESAEESEEPTGAGWWRQSGQRVKQGQWLPVCHWKSIVYIYSRCVRLYIYILHTSTIYKKHVSLSICAFGKGSLDVRAPSYRFSKKWRKPNTTISTSSHLHTITSQASSHHNITTSSHIITSQHHHSTASPYHHIAASPHHRITTSSHRPRWCLKVRNRTSPYVFPRNASSLWAVPILVRPSPKYWPERSLDRSVFPHLPGEGPYLLLLHLLPSTASSRSQWAVGTAGPQPQAPDLSGHCKNQISVGTAGPQE